MTLRKNGNGNGNDAHYDEDLNVAQIKVIGWAAEAATR